MEFYSLDYVNGQDGECELVYDDQLYATKEAAYAARAAMSRPELFDVTMYRRIDLYEVYGTTSLEIDSHLRVIAEY